MQNDSNTAILTFIGALHVEIARIGKFDLECVEYVALEDVHKAIYQAVARAGVLLGDGSGAESSHDNP